MARALSEKRESYLRSRLFKRLFLSYVLLIAVFLGIYAIWYLSSYRISYEEKNREKYQQLTASWGTAMDQQLLTAQALCASVSASDSCRSVLQTVYVQKTTVEPTQLYRFLGELTRIKASSNSMNIYSLVLGIYGDSKVFIPGSVISCEGEVTALEQYPVLRRGSASELLGLTGSSITLNKSYLIYADRYAGFGTGTPDKGQILVLFEPNGLVKLSQSRVPDATGFVMTDGEEVVLCGGEATGVCFSVDSLVLSTVRYDAYLPKAALTARFPLSALWPLMAVMMVGALFIVITYEVAKRYYQPIGNIGQMIEPEKTHVDGFDDILEGIRGLIGERNGYREKMITISPYARQGMLHSIISGGVKDQQLRVMINEQFDVLRKPCFMLGLINLADNAQDTPIAKYNDALALISQACREMSSEDYPIATLVRDPRNMYVIISGDETPELEEAFYRLHENIAEALDDPNMTVTIGVSRREDDLEQLKTACDEAENALNCMLAGGRGSVYFDAVAQDEEQKRYHFPKDAVKRMQRDFQEGNLGDLEGMLEEIYQQNVVQADLSVAELRSLVDEIHVTVRRALREAFDMSTTHFELTRVPQPATIDEILAYYRYVFSTILSQLPVAEPVGDHLEEEICDYIEANLYSPDLSQNAIADRFGLSSKAVSSLCKSHYGTTFLQYVRDRQIRRAAELLQSTDDSLEQIAQQCGFTNLLTFRRNFKAVMNMNPSDFRK